MNVDDISVKTNSCHANQAPMQFVLLMDLKLYLNTNSKSQVLNFLHSVDIIYCTYSNGHRVSFPGQSTFADDKPCNYGEFPR